MSPLFRHMCRVALIACAGVIGAANATPVTVAFSGGVSDDPFGITQLGAPIIGSFSFDTTALDLIADASTGGYLSQGSDFGFKAVVSGVTYDVLGSVFVGVVNGLSDQFTVTAQDGSTTLELMFDDPSGSAFGNDALPGTLSLLPFAFRQFRLFGDDVELLGTVDTLSVSGVPTPVPEPATTVLLGAGLLLLKLRRRALAPLGVTAALLTAAPAFAVDGVTLIDQNKALAGNVTVGDAAGFPVTITQPGSYRLTSNLTIADPNTSAIQIAADHVTLDLNGFAILGPANCTGGCTSTAIGIGVQTSPDQFPRFNITVRNGTIQGMGSHGVDLAGDSNLVEQVSLRGNGGKGITLRDSGDATRGGSSTVRNSMALRNAKGGISVSHGVASFNTSSLNGGPGIVVGTGSARFNVITDNVGGLVMTAGNYIGNVMFANTGPAVAGGMNQGQNVCNNNPCSNPVF